MFCPSCGAENKSPDQRYCRECGASLPVDTPRSQALLHRPSGGDLQPRSSGQQGRHLAILGGSVKNTLIAGVVGVVVLVVALNIIIHLIIATITAVLLPLTVVAAAVIIGYYYLRSLGKR